MNDEDSEDEIESDNSKIKNRPKLKDLVGFRVEQDPSLKEMKKNIE